MKINKISLLLFAALLSMKLKAGHINKFHSNNQSQKLHSKNSNNMISPNSINSSSSTNLSSITQQTNVISNQSNLLSSGNNYSDQAFLQNAISQMQESKKEELKEKLKNLKSKKEENKINIDAKLKQVFNSPIIMYNKNSY